MKGEEGQTLVIVVMVMILALAVGVSVSTRFISAVRFSTQADSSSRALSIADAGVERMLNTSNSVLEQYIANNNCGSACTLQIAGADGITATANIKLSYVGNTSQPLQVLLKTDSSIEVNLLAYQTNANLAVCWNTPSSGEYPSVVGLFVSGTSSSYAAANYAYNTIGSLNGSNGFSQAAAGYGYSNCFTVPGSANPVLLRLRAVYRDATAYVIPLSGATIPSQGILIESTGTVSDTVRKVSVVKSSPLLPVTFDYVLYSRSATDALSN